MTSAELSARKRELENAIKGISDAAPVQAELAAALDAVEAEQADRARIAQGTGTWPGTNGV